MTKELARVRPNAYAQLPRQEIMIDTYPKLLQRISRGQRRGEYGSVSRIVHVGPSEWAVKVTRIKDEPPRWQRPLIVVGSVLSGVMLTCASVALAVGKLLESASKLAAGVSIAGVIGGGVVLMLAAVVVKSLFGNPRVSVKVDVR